MSRSLDDLVAVLRADGDDSAAIEAKRASGGRLADIAQTLSAFANTPGGGTIVFGIDEASGDVGGDCEGVHANPARP